MCSAWADAFGIWATAIEPYSSQMIDRNGKVNHTRRCPGASPTRRNVKIWTIAQKFRIEINECWRAPVDEDGHYLFAVPV
jgi:hypothetical protein